MAKTVEAVYEGGVFRPLEPVTLQDGEHVHIPIVEDEALKKRVEENLALAFSVYEGLSKEEIAEIEKIALDRSHWSGRHE